jgi:uncharacterized protein (TIGR02646 family)
MKHIIKKYASPDETPSFTAWKQRKKLTKPDLLKKRGLQTQQSAIWKTFTKCTAEKNDLKADLLAEQGYICCYCQSRIHLNSHTQIEHFIPRSIVPLQMFDYVNLLASCDGGQQERTDNTTVEYVPKFCGAAKDNNLLTINPIDASCEQNFSYEIGENFEIEMVGNTVAANTVIHLLNLNLPYLKRLRGNAIKDLITDENDDFLAVTDLLLIKNQILARRNEQFYPFCAIINNIITQLIH